MEINRKDNGLYRIDDISLEAMVRICTLCSIKVAEAEMYRGSMLKELKELTTEFNNKVEKAIWSSKKS